jgi:hypothetical protein
MTIRCSNSLDVRSAIELRWNRNEGRKVFTLQTLPAVEVDDRYAQVAKDAGFSLHAGVA